MKKEKIKPNNLLEKRPDIAKQWDYGMNKPLRPEHVSVGSSIRKVWWRCNKGHRWQATVASRTTNGNGCPVCVNKVIIAGYNDLETLDPEISKQWNYEKNGELKPSQVSLRSNKRVWWKCEKEHEYQLRINDKTIKKHKCPYCNNRKILPGYNDLKTLRPDIASEWDDWVNSISPSEVGVHSNKKVGWVCNRGHRWEARINDRTKIPKGTGCPICARKLKPKKKIEINNVFL